MIVLILYLELMPIIKPTKRTIDILILKTAAKYLLPGYHKEEIRAWIYRYLALHQACLD